MHRICGKAVVALIFGRNIAAHSPGHCNRLRAEYNHAGKGIGTIHQRGWPFKDFHAVDGCSVYLDSVLVAPLLPFLANSVIDHDNPVVAETADYRLGNAAAGCDFGNSGFPCNGADDIGRSP